MTKRDILEELLAEKGNRFFFKKMPIIFLAYAFITAIVAGVWTGVVALFVVLLGLGIPFFFEWRWAAERLRKEEEEPVGVEDDWSGNPRYGHQRYNPMDDW